MATEVVPSNRILQALAIHPAGPALKAELRWMDFHSPSDTPLWRQVIGPGANVWDHTISFYRHARLFARIEPHLQDPRLKSTFLLGVLSHDFGEAKINGVGVGDMAWYRRTPESERKEALIAHGIIGQLDLEPPLRQRMSLAHHEVVSGGNPTLHHAFKALERADYVLTALHVYAMGRMGLVIARSQELIGKVITNDLTRTILQFTDHYPRSIGAYFHSVSGTIDSAIASAAPYLHSYKDTDAQLKIFTAVWQDFQGRNPGTRDVTS